MAITNVQFSTTKTVNTDLVQKKKRLKHPVKLCEAKFIVTLIHVALHTYLNNNYDQVRKKPAINAERLNKRHETTTLLLSLLYHSTNLPLTPISPLSDCPLAPLPNLSPLPLV